MAQSNVVYEPSMEEIVASIRRIIENNDQEMAVNVQPQELRESSVKRDRLSSDSKWSSQLFADKSSTFTEPDLDSNPKGVLSLSDIAARVRAESQHANSARIISDHDNSMRDLQSVSDESVKQNNDFMLSDSDRDALADSSSVNSRNVADYDEGKEESTLLSPDAGNRVSCSFDQLVVALRESDSRSIDQISADVLRPMLREWLDDNLPGMVEKLVREEIERIARGSSRR